MSSSRRHYGPEAQVEKPKPAWARGGPRPMPSSRKPRGSRPGGPRAQWWRSLPQRPKLTRINGALTKNPPPGTTQAVSKLSSYERRLFEISRRAGPRKWRRHCVGDNADAAVSTQKGDSRGVRQIVRFAVVTRSDDEETTGDIKCAPEKEGECQDGDDNDGYECFIYEGGSEPQESCFDGDDTEDGKMDALDEKDVSDHRMGNL